MRAALQIVGEKMTPTLVGQLNALVEDTEPEKAQEAIAVPIAVELNSDEAWQDFQDTQAIFDEQFLSMQKSPG